MRALLVVLLAALLAGCLRAGEAPAEAAAADGSDLSRPGPALAAAPRAGNATDLGHMPHMHDYWADSDRVTLFDDGVEPSADDALFWTVWQTFIEDSPGRVGGTQWLLPDGAIVYEGTGMMEITASWTDPTTTGIAASWRSPDMEAFTAPAPLENGKALQVPVTPGMTDMPHMSTSRWVFRFYPSGTPGAALGPFDLKVDIVRMRDVMEFPGHPEHFQGLPQKTILDVDAEGARPSYAKRIPILVTEGHFDEDEIAPTEIVPMETLWMKVDVTVADATATAGDVSEIRFFYRGADTSGWHRMQPFRGDWKGNTLTWEFPVVMEETDTPYGTESQWRFFVEAATSAADAAPTCGGCVDTTISYHITATAFDHVPEGAKASKEVGGEE